MAGSLVLSIPREYVVDLYKESSLIYGKDEILRWYDQILRNSTFNDRAAMESTTEFRQIVACCIVHSGNRILCIRRSRKSGRSAIRLKFTLLIGGHVDEADERAADPIANCVRREINEEIGLEITRPPRLLGFIGDARNAVGMLHLAAIFAYEHESSMIKLRRNLDIQEFSSTSVKSALNFWGPKKIRRFSDSFDPWSSLVLKSGLIETLTGSTIRVIDQEELPLRWRA